MRRRALQVALMASVLGALCVMAIVVSMAPRVRARKVSDRLVARAQELAGQGDRSASRQLVDEALTIDPDNLRARRELAMQMIAEGHLKPAVEELRKAAVAQPTDGGAARELAHLLHMTGDKGGAVQWLREAVRRNPEDGFAYVDLAVCLMGAGEIADGLSAAEEAVRASPRLHSAQLVLGRARWESGDPAGARAAFDQALLLRPRDVDTLLAAAAVSTELGLEDSALGYARHAVTADPESARAWLVLAGGLAATGRAVEADEALSQARSLDPTAPLFQPSAGANGGGRHAVGHPER